MRPIRTETSQVVALCSSSHGSVREIYKDVIQNLSRFPNEIRPKLAKRLQQYPHKFCQDVTWQTGHFAECLPLWSCLFFGSLQQKVVPHLVSVPEVWDASPAVTCCHLYILLWFAPWWPDRLRMNKANAWRCCVKKCSSPCRIACRTAWTSQWGAFSHSSTEMDPTKFRTWDLHRSGLIGHFQLLYCWLDAMLHTHFGQDLVERAEKALPGKICADSSSPTIRNKRHGRSWETGFHR